MITTKPVVSEPILPCDRPSGSEVPIGVTRAIDAAAFANVRRRMVLEHCKWDPQVGDVSTLAPFALTVSAATWRRLAAWAEQLAAEAADAEAELLGRPDLHERLRLPRSLRRALHRCLIEGPTPAAARVIRFDFHWTREGWRISEANADVPGGFSEGSALPRLVAERLAASSASYRCAGDPGGAYADAIASSAERVRGAVALLSAPGFMEDQQVIEYLALLLRQRGLRAWIARPNQLRWSGGHAMLDTGAGMERLSAVVRFHQAEWLASMRRGYWEPLLTGGQTPVANPITAVLIESKRFPLVWRDLAASLPTWQQLLPETRDPRDAPWHSDRDDRWLLKTPLCNTGDTVSMRSRMTERQWRALRRDVWWRPGHWVAQRRFEIVPIETPLLGPMCPCIGVYTTNGRAAGAYCRLAPGPVVDYAAVDAALLIDATVEDVQ